MLQSIRYFLVWLANAVGISRQAGAPSGGEAIVSFERIGPDGTSAGSKPGSSVLTIAVTLSLKWNCRAAGGFLLWVTPGRRGSKSLRSPHKNLIWVVRQ